MSITVSFSKQMMSGSVKLNRSLEYIAYNVQSVFDILNCNCKRLFQSSK